MFEFLKCLTRSTAPKRKRRPASTVASTCETLDQLTFPTAIAVPADVVLIDPPASSPSNSSHSQSTTEITSEAGPTVQTRPSASRGRSLISSNSDREPNNSRLQADSRGTISGSFNRTYYGHIGSSGDTQDYSSLTLTSSAVVEVSMSGLTADLDIELQNSVGHRITSSTNSGRLSESFSTTLRPGTYYFRIYQYRTSVSAYALRLQVTPRTEPPRTDPPVVNPTASPIVNNDVESNNTRETANNRGSFSGGSRTFYGHIGLGGDTQDYSRLTLTGSGTLSVSLNSLTADLDLQLYDSAGRLLTSSSRSGTSSEFLSRNLGPGTYFLRVYQYRNAVSAYSLRLNR